MTPADRRDYSGEGLLEEQLAPTPWQQASAWVDAARRRAVAEGDVPEPTALSVATVDAAGRPDVRTVLMRFFDPAGPGFVTNLASAKGRHIEGNPSVAASLTWPSMYRAVRFRGTAHQIERSRIEEYFRGRPWGSRISAWASEQSQVIASRAELEDAYARFAGRWPDRGLPDDVPVPPAWGGYRISCDEVEFWAGRRDRLHDRLVFVRVSEGSLDDPGAWRVERRAP